MTERPVEREGVRRRPHVEALREHDLDAVSVGDELACSGDARHVLHGRAVGTDLGGRGRVRRERRERAVQLREHAVDRARGRAGRGRVVVREDGERVPQVVEGDDRVVDREHRLGHAPGRVRIVRRDRQTLEAARGLVPDEPNGTAVEPRQPRSRSAPVSGELVAHRPERIGRRLLADPPPAPRSAIRIGPLLDDDRAVAEGQRRPWRQADEGVAAHPLAALDRLEEERAAERAQLRERRDRSLEVGEPFARDRHEVHHVRCGDRHDVHSPGKQKPSSEFRDEGSWCHPISARHCWRTLSLRDHGAPR